MLYKIEGDFLKGENLSHDQLLAIAKLLDMYRSRYHIILASPDFLNHIISSDDFGRLDKITASELLDYRIEFGQYINLVSSYVIVDFSYSGEPVKRDAPTPHTLVSYRYFDDSFKPSTATLLVENYEDYKFFLCVSESYSRCKLGKNASVDLTFSNGAGSHCKTQLKMHLGEKEFVLCITDSDKKHPGGKEGSTSRSFRNSERGFFATHRVLVLEVHEIENIIPLEIIEEAVISYAVEKVTDLDDIKRLLSVKPEVRPYIDYKLGMSACNLLELDKVHGRFWGECLKVLFPQNQCLESDNCIFGNSCCYIPGLGEGLLNNTLKILQRKSPREIAKTIESSGCPEISYIQKLVFSWGCSPGFPAYRS